MISAIITDLGNLFLDSTMMRTISVARAYYLWSDYQSSYISKETYKQLRIMEYGTPEWASCEDKHVVKGMEYHVIIRTASESVYLIRVGVNYEDALKCAKRLTRGIWMQACSSGQLNHIDLRNEDNPNFIVSLMPQKAVSELLPILEEL